MKRLLLMGLCAGMATSAQSAPIYVDNQLSGDCQGTYSVMNRDCSGIEGDAYTSIIEASNRAVAGDTVLIREGVYHTYNGRNDVDVLWPKNSGAPGQPITFKNFAGEEVILGRHPTHQNSYPNDNWASIARGVITMKDVSYITIEGLKVDQVAGWAFIRNCDHIIVKNCQFRNARWGAKGCFRMIEVKRSKLLNNSFVRSTFDNVYLVASDYNILEGNYFDDGEHSVLALRGSNYNVIRNNIFRNPYIRASSGMAEKLIEVYDIKLDTRDPANPAYVSPPRYDATQHNLFEKNWFGYHPYWPNHGAQPSAMQFSGQRTIIRRNIFSNPPVPNPSPDYEPRIAGGKGIILRWGGSWEGWNGKKVVGEGHEAGFVYENRIYNNTFNGYDNGQVTAPSDNAMDKFPKFGPMKNVADYENYPFDHTWKFGDNLFKNNIFYEGNFVPHVGWADYQYVKGTPTQVMMRGGCVANIPHFTANDFFATGTYNDTSIENVTDWIIYNHSLYPYQPSKSPAFYNTNHPERFTLNVQLDPGFANPAGEDFHLKGDSPLVDAGAYLTRATNDGSGSTLQVDDARYFFDGYGIEGETGDVIQLEGQAERAQVLAVDYKTNSLTLNRSLEWVGGEGIGLAYANQAPDMGAYEFGLVDNLPTITPPPPPQPPPTNAGLLPTGFQTFKNVFNPARGEEINIAFTLDKESPVSLSVYDREGREIKTFGKRNYPAGADSEIWDGRNASGKLVSSGVYLIVMRVDGTAFKKKVVALK